MKKFNPFTQEPDYVGIDEAEKGSPGGVATLGSDGKIPASQIPSIALTDTYIVANEEEMLDLEAEHGDVAIRTDEDITYILAGSDPAVLSDWWFLRFNETETDPIFTAWRNENIGLGTVALEGWVQSQGYLIESDLSRSAWDGASSWVGTYGPYVLFDAEGSIEDDGKYYARRNGAWEEAPRLKDKIGVSVDGSGAVITTGSKHYSTVPMTGVLTKYFLVSDISGSIVFDIKINGTSIVGAGNKPTLSGAQYANANLTSWTSVAVTEGDRVEFYVDSASTLTWVQLILKITA